MRSSSRPSGRDPEMYCQPNASLSRSASSKVSQKYFIPQRHGSWSTLTKKLETTTRMRSCSHPVAQSSLIPASTRG
uniref:Uncharacterized protein n=1 Tax=Arundo donax TaxID=35708 RepID=A0A0A9CZX1_ARUDO